MQPRGADVVARALERAGARTVFTLSGNHIMPIFDAVLETGLKLVHCRHEAAAVHMADAWARVTGACGVALVTGGPGHANAVPALYTALAAESPVVLVSGHASLGEIGRGSFQEMRQAELADPVAKASWTVRSASELEGDVERAFRLATSGRPGPVHVSLPFDLLEAAHDTTLQQTGLAPADSAGRTLSELEVSSVLAALASAERPLILAGPLLCRLAAGEGLARLSAALKVPAIGMESPRGVNDPSLGAFADLLPRADLILLLGKKHDFTLRFAEPPFVDAGCRFMVIDPEAEAVERVAREKRDRLVLSVLADAAFAADQLSRAGWSRDPDDAWYREATRAIAYRPPEWEALALVRQRRGRSSELSARRSTARCGRRKSRSSSATAARSASGGNAWSAHPGASSTGSPARSALPSRLRSEREPPTRRRRSSRCRATARLDSTWPSSTPPSATGSPSWR